MGHQEARWVGNAIRVKSGRECDRGDRIHLGSVSERLGEVLTRCSELDTEDRVRRGACRAQTGMSCKGSGVTDVVGYGLLVVSRPIQRWL